MAQTTLTTNPRREHSAFSAPVDRAARSVAAHLKTVRAGIEDNPPMIELLNLLVGKHGAVLLISRA